jgi:hypothetical protein
VVASPVGAEPVPPGQDRNGARRWLPLLVVALLVVVFGVAYLSRLGHQGVPTAGTTTTSTAAKPKATSTPKISEQPPAPSAAPPTAASAPPTANADQRLGSFLTSYYSDVTQDTGRTWGELTTRMQQYAQGRASYDGFWHGIAGVRVNSTRATSGTSAVVNLTFTRKGGTTSTENHQFTFVTQGVGYLIDSDLPVR